MTTIKPLAIALIFYSALTISTHSRAAQIVCDIDVSNEQNQLPIKPSNDVYAFSKIDLPSGFRVSGQYLLALNKFKLNVYSHSKNRYVLLSAQEFTLSSEACTRDFGINRLYGEPYERELFLHCRQMCDK